MRPEGHLRKRIRKEDLIEDIVCWGIETAKSGTESRAV